MSSMNRVGCPACKIEGGFWVGDNWVPCLQCRGEGLVLVEVPDKRQQAKPVPLVRAQ